jgi:type IV pilus assembly protein PilB
VVVINNEISRMIMNGESASRIKQMAVQHKSIFLIDDGLLKVKQGLTTTEEILRVAISE